MTNIEVIRSFVSAWSRLDPNELSEYFSEDGSYHNMPMGPIVGKENIKAFIENFSSSWTETEWQILNIVEEGIVLQSSVCPTLTETPSMFQSMFTGQSTVSSSSIVITVCLRCPGSLFSCLFFDRSVV